MEDPVAEEVLEAVVSLLRPNQPKEAVAGAVAVVEAEEGAAAEVVEEEGVIVVNTLRYKSRAQTKGMIKNRNLALCLIGYLSPCFFVLIT